MIRFFKTPHLFRWVFPRRVWSFSSSDSIYLTFDDGPTEELTSWILDLLDEKRIKATFFCVGSNAKRYPKLIREIKDRGHGIGNHTMNHLRGTKVSRQAYLRSIAETNQYIDSKLFRPPYGRLPVSYARSVRSKYKVIMWTWLSYDFDDKVSTSRILERAEKQIEAGDIIVVHDNKKIEGRTKELLPKLIDLLQQKGYKFDVISA